MTMKLPPIKPPARRGIDPEAARALAESEGLGIPTAPDGVPSRSQAVGRDQGETVKLKEGSGRRASRPTFPPICWTSCGSVP